jgi:hypothetical protein
LLYDSIETFIAVLSLSIEINYFVTKLAHYYIEPYFIKTKQSDEPRRFPEDARELPQVGQTPVAVEKIFLTTSTAFIIASVPANIVPHQHITHDFPKKL